MAKWSSAPIGEELPRLIADDPSLSLRKIAERVDVNVAHLSRGLRGEAGKRIAPELAREIALALDLPEDYFPEYRESVVFKAVSADPALRDRLYRRLR